MKFNRTRIAPTPSGFLHLGNAYSFLLTKQLASKYNAEILLRIDDLDTARVRNEYLEDIFDTLNFLNVSWQLGPGNVQQCAEHSQLARLGHYRLYLDELREKNLVFACECSRKGLRDNQELKNECKCCDKQLSLDKENISWRLKTDAAGTIAIKTFNQGVKEMVFPDAMKNFIVKKKDGMPAYQLCSLADDVFFKIDLIIRGEDLWASSLAQLFLARCLDLSLFTNVCFHHHSLIKASDGHKLSKSAGDTSIRSLRQKGLNLAELLQHLKSAGAELES